MSLQRSNTHKRNMSWSGFKKAVNRAGAHVYMKTNKNGSEIESNDPEFNKQEQNFHKVEKMTFELNNELVKFIENFENLIEVQFNIVKSMDSFYGDFSFDLETDKKMENLSAINEKSISGGATAGLGGGLSRSASTRKKNNRFSVDSFASSTLSTPKIKPVNNRDGITLEYLKLVNEIKEEILPNLLEPLNVTVLNPIDQLKNYNVEIDSLIKKRNRKKLDYDMMKFKLTKLQQDYEVLDFQVKNQDLAEKEKDLNKSLDKLNKLKTEFDEIDQVYNPLNTNLKDEIQQYISLRFSLIDPVFESFIKIQLKLYNDIFNKLTETRLPIDASGLQDYKQDKLDDRLNDILLKMKSLDLKNL